MYAYRVLMPSRAFAASKERLGAYPHRGRGPGVLMPSRAFAASKSPSGDEVREGIPLRFNALAGVRCF